MIPILYEKNETSFTSNGIGRLDELTSCVVTEERNGEFTLKATCLTTARMYKEIKKDRIIFATAHDGDDGQPFRINTIGTPLNKEVEIEAEHISYQLSWIPLIPFSAANCPEAMSKLSEKSVTTNPFTFWTNINTVANFMLETPSSVRSILGGVRGSILDIYGGEYEFDKYTVKLYSQRGADNGVELRYGKNITDISQDESIENTYTGILPYWQDENTLVTVDGYIVNSQYASSYAFNRVLVVDFSSDFEDAPTKAQLLARAQSYISSNNIGIPKVSIDVSFIALWQTDQYKDVANLERVHLCDYVNVYFEKLGIEAKAKVVKTVYDVLHDRYDEITIGSIDASLAQTISNINSTIEQSASDTRSAYQKAIDNATQQITGAKGGVIQMHYDANDKPYEMTIANNENLASATKVWRWNIGGLGYSEDGYNGPYTLAITQDGAIVADFITTGTLDASKATITNINASNINTGTIKNKTNNNSYWNLVTGEFKTTNGTFVNANVQTASGNLWMNLANAELSGGRSGTKHGDITFDTTINNNPAMAIQADNILLAGPLHTATSKDAVYFYQGRTATFNNVVSGLSVNKETLPQVISTITANWQMVEDVVCDIGFTWENLSYIEDIERDGNTFYWTQKSRDFISQVSWDWYNLNLLDSLSWTYYTNVEHVTGATWTNNTMSFVNGLLV